MNKDQLIDWHDALCETHRGRTQLAMFDELGVDRIIGSISVVRAEERVEHWTSEHGKTVDECQGGLWRDGFLQGMLYAQRPKDKCVCIYSTQLWGRRRRTVVRTYQSNCEVHTS